MLPLVGIVNIMKIKQYQIHEKMYRYRVWCNRLKCNKTCYFLMKPNVET
jgi:hypothetical protein